MHEYFQVLNYSKQTPFKHTLQLYILHLAHSPPQPPPPRALTSRACLGLLLHELFSVVAAPLSFSSARRLTWRQIRGREGKRRGEGQINLGPQRWQNARQWSIAAKILFGSFASNGQQRRNGSTCRRGACLRGGGHRKEALTEGKTAANQNYRKWCGGYICCSCTVPNTFSIVFQGRIEYLVKWRGWSAK